MAFSVAPTSGVAPYLLSAAFTNGFLIDGLNYNITVRSTTSAGSCPVEGSSAGLSAAQITQLLAQGSVQSLNSVPLGNCRTITLRILRVSDGAVIETSNAYINNL